MKKPLSYIEPIWLDVPESFPFSRLGRCWPNTRLAAGRSRVRARSLGTQAGRTFRPRCEASAFTVPGASAPGQIEGLRNENE